MELQVGNVEEAILQAEVDVRAHRIAQAEDPLPGDFALTVGETENALRDGRFSVHLHVGDADTSASVTAQAVFITKVEQQIDHRCQCAAAAVGIEVVERTGTRNSRVKAHFMDRRALVPKLAFEPEHPKIVAGDGVNIEPGMMPNGYARITSQTVAVGVTEVDIFDPH